MVRQVGNIRKSLTSGNVERGEHADWCLRPGSPVELNPPNVGRFSRAGCQLRRDATQRVASDEAALPPGHSAARCRLLTGVVQPLVLSPPEARKRPGNRHKAQSVVSGFSLPPKGGCCTQLSSKSKLRRQREMTAASF